MNKRILISIIILLIISDTLSILNGVSYINKLEVNFLQSSNMFPFISWQLLIFIGQVMAFYMIVRAIEEQTKRPIRRLTKQVNHFAKGEYSYLPKKEDAQEVQDLVLAIDSMVLNYYRTNRKLRYEKRKAESMLSYLEQGIIVIDATGTIIEINKFAKESLGITITEGNFVHSLYEHTAYQSMIKSTLDNETSSNCEILKDESTLYIKIKPLKKNSREYGYMLSIRDITHIRKFDEMRYQFVSNVTHELKTPLTSIQGFVETLQMGALEQPDVAKHFLEIIDIEAKRLGRLIEDILVLSDTENTRVADNELINLVEVVEEVIELLEQQARQKTILLKTIIVKGEILYCGDREHFKQILINLVSNGIRYTEKGRVEVIVDKEDDCILLKVKDTGVGIAPVHHEQIFERFYRVDKSRSRKSGGTGLGLSIVKHIVQMYQGDISLTSQVGKGTEFIIKLPISA
ncbi:MAG: hypothetical protein ATN36_00465 [Epulopiscium sp. Nele67-Bin005]|nr:MAG: hypothetical protein ATN36_00465 [Epulopiscium sp. Nele67-Bin005]